MEYTVLGRYLNNLIYFLALILIAVLIAVCTFLLTRRLYRTSETKTKETTFLIRSIRAIAELAILEYVTEGVTEIKEKVEGWIRVDWKKGLLRYTAKIKVGFDLDKLDTDFNHSQKNINIKLPEPRVLSCEIYNRNFYKLPLEKAENVRWKLDILKDFTHEEVLALDNEARTNALENVSQFHVLELLRTKTRDAFEKIFAISYPDYKIKVLISPKDGQEKQNRTEHLPPSEEQTDKSDE